MQIKNYIKESCKKELHFQYYLLPMITVGVRKKKKINK